MIACMLIESCRLLLLGLVFLLCTLILSCLYSKFSGERTFGVLTKIDLMDQGTNAVDVSLLRWFSFSLTFTFRKTCDLMVCIACKMIQCMSFRLTWNLSKFSLSTASSASCLWNDIPVGHITFFHHLFYAQNSPFSIILAALFGVSHFP